jgi:hypothetical protein
MVALAPFRARGTEAVPAAVLDLVLRTGDTLVDETDLDLGRIEPILAKVPQVRR